MLDVLDFCSRRWRAFDHQDFEQCWVAANSVRVFSINALWCCIHTSLHSFAISRSSSVPCASCLRRTASSNSIDSYGCVDFLTVTLFFWILLAAMHNSFLVIMCAPCDGWEPCRKFQLDSVISVLSVSQSAFRKFHISFVCEAASETLKDTVVTTFLWPATTE